MSAAKTNNKNKKKQKPAWRNPGQLLSRGIHGKVISLDFFSRHWIPTVLAIALLMAYITTKYVCQTRMEQINALNHRLEIVKAERIRVRSEYMGRTCESSMQQLVDTLHMNLTVPENPPVRLK